MAFSSLTHIQIPREWGGGGHMKKSPPSGPEAPPRATPAPPGVFSEGVLNPSGGKTYSGTPLATASLSLSPQLCTRDQLSLWGQGRFCKLFRHGFHAGPLPSQHLWWEKHSRRTTGILQIDTDKNSPAGSLYPVGPGPAWHDQAQPGAPLREGGTEGGETESQCREQLMEQTGFQTRRTQTDGQTHLFAIMTARQQGSSFPCCISTKAGIQDSRKGFF